MVSEENNLNHISSPAALTINSGVEQSGRTVGDKGVPGAEQDGDVVVPVKKHQFLLVGNNEKCIEEFGGFAQNEKETPHSRGGGSDTVFGVHAQIIVESVGGDIVDEGGQETGQSDPGENGECQIPSGQGLFHHVGLSRFHVLLAVVNGEHVNDAAGHGEPVVAVHPVPEIFGSPREFPADGVADYQVVVEGVAKK